MYIQFFPEYLWFHKCFQRHLMSMTFKSGITILLSFNYICFSLKWKTAMYLGMQLIKLGSSFLTPLILWFSHHINCWAHWYKLYIKIHRCIDAMLPKTWVTNQSTLWPCQWWFAFELKFAIYFNQDGDDITGSNT